MTTIEEYRAKKRRCLLRKKLKDLETVDSLYRRLPEAREWIKNKKKGENISNHGQSHGYVTGETKWYPLIEKKGENISESEQQ